MWQKRPKIETIVGPKTRLEGTIYSRGMIRIDGFLNGVIADAQEVIVGRTGKVEGDIKAKIVTVSGNVTGNITALNSIRMLANSQVCGDIETRDLSVSPGVISQGNCTVVKENTELVDRDGNKEHKDLQ